MCKYCKDLKDLRNRDKLYYESLIRAWKRQCVEAEKIISDLFVLLEYKGVNYGPAYERLHKRACHFLDVICVKGGDRHA